MDNPVDAKKERKKKWLTALVAAVVAVVEVTMPHAGPLVRAILELRHVVGQDVLLPAEQRLVVDRKNFES